VRAATGCEITCS